jgi:Peptidase S24-like
MTVAPLLYGFRSAVTNASWVIDLDIIQTIDCECFSKLGLKRVLARCARAPHATLAHGDTYRRSVAPTNNCIVLALLDGEFTVKRYRRRGDVITLTPENPAFSPIDITEDRAFEIWGVITRSIRML